MIDWTQISWTYIIAQIFGLMQGACMLIGPLYKEKWQMLVNSMASVTLLVLNLVFLGNATSGIAINFVAFVMLSCSLWHVRTNTKPYPVERIIFYALYLIVGGLGIKESILAIIAGNVGFYDIVALLPMVGGAFFMIAAYERSEQKTRLLYLFNTFTFCTYHFCLMNYAAGIGQIAAFSMNAIALYHYRKKPVSEEAAQ